MILLPHFVHACLCDLTVLPLYPKTFLHHSLSTHHFFYITAFQLITFLHHSLSTHHFFASQPFNSSLFCITAFQLIIFLHHNLSTHHFLHLSLSTHHIFASQTQPFNSSFFTSQPFTSPHPPFVLHHSLSNHPPLPPLFFVFCITAFQIVTVLHHSRSNRHCFASQPFKK